MNTVYLAFMVVMCELYLVHQDKSGKGAVGKDFRGPYCSSQLLITKTENGDRKVVKGYPTQYIYLSCRAVDTSGLERDRSRKRPLL